MELKDVRTGDAVGASFLRGKSTSVAEDVLGGRDNEIGGWEGIYGGELRPFPRACQLKAWKSYEKRRDPENEGWAILLER